MSSIFDKPIYKMFLSQVAKKDNGKAGMAIKKLTVFGIPSLSFTAKYFDYSYTYSLFNENKLSSTAYIYYK